MTAPLAAENALQGKTRCQPMVAGEGVGVEGTHVTSRQEAFPALPISKQMRMTAHHDLPEPMAVRLPACGHIDMPWISRSVAVDYLITTVASDASLECTEIPVVVRRSMGYFWRHAAKLFPRFRSIGIWAARVSSFSEIVERIFVWLSLVVVFSSKVLAVTIDITSVRMSCKTSEY